MTDRRIALALGLVVLTSRLPFLAQRLFEWDSVLYARALESGFHVDTDLAAARPHPPGYILYVAVASLFRAALGDSNAALVLLAAVASAATVAVTYLVARHHASRPVALACVLGLATSPLFWTYGEVALPYTVLALLSVTCALLFRRARGGAGERGPVVATLVFGLLAGARQDLLLLLAPLWLWMVIPSTWRGRMVALAAGAIGCLAWFVPSAILSGGAVAYLEAVLAQTAHVGTTFSFAGAGAPGLAYNAALTAYGLFWGAGAFLVLIVPGLVRVAPAATSRAFGFFSCWLVPPLVAYVGLHIGEPGYILSLLPGVFVLCAAILSAALPPRRATAVAGILLAADALTFVALDTPFSANAIASHDRGVANGVAAVRARFGPADVEVLAQPDYLIARYYLPEYRVYWVGDAPEALARAPRAVPIGGGRVTVVRFGYAPGIDDAITEPLGEAPSRAAIVSPGARVAFAAYALE